MWRVFMQGFFPVRTALSPEDKQLCDGPLSLEEVEKAIAGLGLNKSPGSDGLTGEFYRKFKRQLAPILLSLFLDVESTSRLPGIHEPQYHHIALQER